MLRRTRLFIRYANFLLVLPFLSYGIKAQMPVSSSTTSTPVPGAGHDYLGAINETVNPANGSVSLRINTTVPPGRGLTLPFGFAYDSNGVNYVSTPQQNGALLWSNPSTTVVSMGGWSETVPVVTATEITWTALDDSGHEQPCYAFVNYVYQDASGDRHNLNLTNFSGNNPNSACSYATNDWPVGFTGSVVTSGGEDGYSPAAGAIIASIPAGNGSGASVGPVTVTQPDGTTSFFPATGEDTAQGALATSVEDSNGNFVQITPSSSSGYTYTDTLGRSLINDSQFGESPESVSVLGYNSPYTLYWQSLATPSFELPVTTVSGSCPSYFGHVAWTAPSAVSSIMLPDQLSFTFSYDATYKVLNRITYPTGAYVRYVWGINSEAETGHSNYPSSDNTPNCVALYAMPVITDRFVSFNGSTEVLHQQFSYSTTWNLTDIYAPRWTTKTTVVTTTDEVRNTSYTTTYTYSPIGVIEPPNSFGAPTPTDPVEQSIAYNDTNGALLKTVYKTWQNPRLLSSEETQYADGEASQTTWTYNGREQETGRVDYDFGSGGVGGPLRSVVTNYQQFNDTPLYSASPGIVDRPCQIITYDGSGNRYAETDGYYDNGSTGTPCGSAGTPSVVSAGGNSLTDHDETSYSAGSGSPRGNLTTLVKQCFPSSVCSAGSPTTTYSYDETGQAVSMTDPNGNITKYSYADSFLNTNSNGYSTTAGTPPNGKVTNAYLTTLTRPSTGGVAHVSKYSYGYNDGELTQSSDENTPANHTTYKYNDPLGRITETDYPDGGETSLSYSDPGPSPSVTTNKLMTSTQTLSTTSTLDGLGHVTQTTINYDPSCSSGDITATAYDGLGRAYTVSNPYCTTSDPDYGLTTYVYDALGRITTLTHPGDNTSITTQYAGRATSVTDEGQGAGNGGHHVQRVSQIDGLGRLASVCEVTNATMDGVLSGSPSACGQDIGATGYLTSYSYDPLGNMTGVTQGALNPRTFSYDSLSRLTNATNPESGTFTYSYDADGNLSQRTSSKLTSTGVKTVITYGYDALNRLVNKEYNDGTPGVGYYYDQPSPWGLGQYEHNYIGRLTQTGVFLTNGTSLAGSVNSYDAMGRIVYQWQCTPSDCGKSGTYFAYTYDLLGDLVTSYNNTDNITYTNSYNAADELTEVQSALGSQSPNMLVTYSNFTAFQEPKQVAYGNGIANSFWYDQRLRLYGFSYATGFPALYTYGILNGSTNGYAPDNEILFSSDSVNGNWAYTYDDFGRLQTASCTSSNCPNATGSGGYDIAYSYDRFGNRWTESAISGGFNGIQPQYEFNANNQIDVSGVTYDGAGNVLAAGVGIGDTFTYDAENRISTGTFDSASYVYDAFGNRVSSTVNGQESDFLHDLEGRTIDQYTLNGTQTTVMRSEAYAGPQHIVSYTNGSPVFENGDWLGTARLRSNTTGGVVESCTSLPFGEDLTCSTSDVSPMHFTGKERDSESGLDNFGFRYYASSMGRFMKPDESLVYWDRSNPQSLNLYEYALNNPTSNTDDDGHDCVYLNNSGSGVESVDQSSSSGECGNTGGYWVQGAATNAQINGDSLTLTGTTNGVDNNTSATYLTNGDTPLNSTAQDVFSNPVFNNAAGTVNALGMLEASIMAPWAVAAAQCSTGGSRGACAANMAMTVLPEAGALREGAVLLKEGAAIGKGAEILQKAGGLAQAAKDYESLQGAEAVYGSTKVKTLADGTKAVLYQSTGGSGAPTLAFQDAAGRTVTKIRY